MLSDLELFIHCASRSPNGRKANDGWLGQTAGSPCPDRTDPFAMARRAMETN
jgi:hypothetical protein